MAFRAPDRETFEECCNWASAAALMAATAIVRDEPWSEMVRLTYLWAELLRMIEWDHLLRYDGARDVRYLGTRMRRWMDNDVQRDLEASAPTYGRDNTHAVLRGFELFRTAADRVAKHAPLEPWHFDAIDAELRDVLGTPARTPRTQTRLKHG